MEVKGVRESLQPGFVQQEESADELIKYQQSLDTPFKTLDAVNAVFADERRKNELREYIQKFVDSADFVKNFFNLVLHPELSQSCFFRGHG